MWMQSSKMKPFRNPASSPRSVCHVKRTPSSPQGSPPSFQTCHLLWNMHYFTKCCKDSGVLMVVKCRKENSALKDCLTSYYKDPAFYEECKMEYLKEREEFRRTGIPTKKRLQKLPTSM
uniref:COX assembly mitochondrial protein n=1 Tax=Capra hircus TaxID=9925 RepID=A0A8C2RZ96_CAPHI